MSLRFSLLSLIGLVSLSALACAALVQPGPGWLSVVVTLTAGAVIGQVLRALYASASGRAAAVGWLVFAVGYLAMALAPWLGQHVGPQLGTSKGLVYAQVNLRKEDPAAPAVYQNIQPVDLSRTWRSADLWIDGISIMPTMQPQVPGANCFQLSGHWLFAWLAGWLGAALGTHYQKRRQRLGGFAA